MHGLKTESRVWGYIILQSHKDCTLTVLVVVQVSVVEP